MPTFVVRRRVDAYVDYLAEVEAENAAEAAELASETDGDLTWQEEGVIQFDDRVFITLDAVGDELVETEVRS